MSGTLEFAGRTLHRVGYGAMQLSHGRTTPSHGEAVAILRSVAELGVDHIDTAEFYGGGSVNRAIARAFPQASNSPLIATKVGARELPGATPPLIAAQSPAELREDVEANLRSLGRESLDLVYLRRLDSAPGIVASEEQRFPLSEQLAELVTLRKEGLIREIGLSHVSAEQLSEALRAGIVAVQNLYNLVNREGASVLEIARAHGIAWVPYMPLGSGFPGHQRVTELPRVVAAAKRLAVTPGQVGLAWLLAQYDRTMLIPGSLDLAHVRENLAAADVDLRTVFRSLAE
ncbi:aldo/keto reductase [Parafrigoribacterium soli]|uniref:aldo/keto reductase n=1 Tax=Parafrigoribacterium soli TaxID=3144663 RepID=UPI0032F015D1